MGRGFTVMTDGTKRWFGGGLEDVLQETTVEQTEAIAEKIAEITRGKSRERHPVNLGLQGLEVR